MESIFESLENLNVSEECFNEIMGIVEELLNEEDSLDDGSHIRKKYREPEYEKNKDGSIKLNDKGYAIPANKSAEMYAKSHRSHQDEPRYTEGKGIGEYGKRINKGDSDRGAWVTGDTPKEIQEPLAVAKSIIKGTRKLGTSGDMTRADALRKKSEYLYKKAEHLNKAAKFDSNDYDNFEDNADIATELNRQADVRKDASSKARREARRILGLGNKRAERVPKS